MRTWQPHTQRLSTLVFSPDGRLLATAACAPDGLTYAVGSAKGKVVVWDLDV